MPATVAAQPTTRRRHVGTRLRPLAAGAALFVTLLGTSVTLGADNWPEWRGLKRDGRSAETGLPEKWSLPSTAHPAGENLAWRLPIGSRSAPVVWGNRVYLNTAAGTEEDRQERLVAIDATSGKVVWEKHFSLYLTDVPVHRVAWASPAVDPATGNIYVLSGNAGLRAFSPDGKQLWERDLVDDFGAITTHGGRMMSPVIDGDTVIASALVGAWGTLARGGNRFFAFDKKTGQSQWVSSPQQRHWDTNYAAPIIAVSSGLRLAIVGGTDGVFHALKMSTGEPVWRFDVSKRAINNAVVTIGEDVIISHSEENFDTSDMGMLARFPIASKGDVKKEQTKWFNHGTQAGFPTPVIDEAAGLMYLVDNGAVLIGIDVESGKRLWDKNLGTIQKSSPVLADGKLYVGTENGRFYILKPGKAGVEVLDEDVLPISKQEGTGGGEPGPEPIVASPAIAGGRIYLASMEALYAIGPKAPKGNGTTTRNSVPPAAPAGGGPATAARIVPSDVNVKPGQAQKFGIEFFDANGNKATAGSGTATWTLEGLKGELSADGTFTPDKAAGAQGGLVKAAVGGSNVTAVARVRVIPPLPLDENFDAFTAEAPPTPWIGITGKFDVKDFEGSKVLQRREDNTLTRRARGYLGTSDMSNYTVEMDVRSTERRRQMGDVGVIAQRYVLVIFGNSQKVELQPWQPAVKMTVSAPFQWKADTWYRVKMEAQNQKDGTTRVRAKVWPRGETEPTAWLVEKIDKIGHKQGSPGVYADAPWGAYFDNIKVTPNTGS
jgi:outer membrane protein assembly factor BamB